MPSLATYRLLVLFVLVALGGAAGPACRCGAPGSEGAPADPGADGARASSAPSSGEPEPPRLEAPTGDGGGRFADAEPSVALDPDGPIDPACTGAEIALAAAVLDARCAIGSGRAKQLRALLERDAGPLPLKQEASLTSDGKVLLRLVNTGASPLMLPISFHAKLPSFSALAEDELHAIYELEPPRLDLPSASDGGAGERAHFARIVLPPRGAALATATLSRTVVRVIGRRPGAGCADPAATALADGGCVVTRLPNGRYTVHVGELLTDVEAGAPARVAWELR
jgi:hypothetical protein